MAVDNDDVHHVPNNFEETEGVPFSHKKAYSRYEYIASSNRNHQIILQECQLIYTFVVGGDQIKGSTPLSEEDQFGPGMGKNGERYDLVESYLSGELSQFENLTIPITTEDLL